MNSSEIDDSYYNRNYFYTRDEAFEEDGLPLGIPNTKEIYSSRPSDFQNNSLNNLMFTKNKIYSNSYANLYLSGNYSAAQLIDIDHNETETYDDIF